MIDGTWKIRGTVSNLCRFSPFYVRPTGISESYNVKSNHAFVHLVEGDVLAWINRTNDRHLGGMQTYVNVYNGKNKRFDNTS